MSLEKVAFYFNVIWTSRPHDLSSSIASHPFGLRLCFASRVRTAMKEEKQRRFHETLLNILYPQPSSPQRDFSGEEPTATVHDMGIYPDPSLDVFEDLEEKSSDSSSDSGSRQKKLTRAQRKRIRKKKLKEVASCRRKMIGPLLPSTDGIQIEEDNEVEPLNYLHENTNQQMSCGGVQEPNAGNDQGESFVPTAQNRRKHRRMAKRLTCNSSEVAAFNHVHLSCSSNGGIAP